MPRPYAAIVAMGSLTWFGAAVVLTASFMEGGELGFVGMMAGPSSV